MNKYLALTRTLLKSSYMPLAGGKHEKAKSLGLIALIMVSLLPLIAGLAMLVGKLYAPLAAVGQQGVLLGFGCALSGLLIFIFGIFYAINVYYFARDVEFLLPLPLRPGHILGAKFTVTLLYEYLTQLLILGPLLVTWGTSSEGGLNYYLIAAIVFLTLPVIPLVAASILAMLLMSYSSIARNKDRFRIWAGGLGLAAALGAQYALQKFMAKKNPDDLVQLLQQGKNSLADLAMKIFPGVKFAVWGMLQAGPASGWLNLFYFIALSGLFILLLYFLGGLIYFRGAVGGSESFAGQRRLSRAELAQTSQPATQLAALMKKEFLLLIRTPAFFMNCVIINFIWPVIFIFSGASGNREQIAGLQSALGGGLPLSSLLLIGLAASLFVAGTSGASASGISREGSQFFVCKYLPASYGAQIKAKMAVAFLLAFSGFAVLLVVLALAFPLPIKALFLALLLAIPGIALPVQMGMLLDIHFPKLIWDNEYRAVKQNMNIMALMAVAGVLGGGCIYLALAFKTLGWILLAGVVALAIILNLVLYYLLRKNGPEWIAAIDI